MFPIITYSSKAQFPYTSNQDFPSSTKSKGSDVGKCTRVCVEILKMIPILSSRRSKADSVVLKKKNKMDVTDVGTSLLDRIYELFGKGISLQLISSRCADPVLKYEKRDARKEAYLEDWVSKLTSLNAEDHATYNVTFDWDESLGVPGALIVKNQHHSQLYLKTVTLEDVPGHGPVHFICDS
ncbi:Lox9p [Orobanche hederae]